MRSSSILGRSVVLALLGLALVSGPAVAQMFAARADGESLRAPSASTLDHKAIKNYITIEGKAEKRVEATAMRIVLALMAEEETAPECQAACQKLEDEFLKALADLEIDRTAIAVDFISILPVYEWEVETRQDKNMAVEKRAGFRMQSNVHIEVPNEQRARAVLQAAFKLDISDIIAFDYGNDDLDQIKIAARKEALKVAREKAQVLLEAMFDEPPKPLNVHESTRVIFPRTQYGSFENTYQQLINIPYSGDRMPQIRAAKPKNTYYRGLQEETDVRAKGLPLRPMISVVSTVRLYYATPKRAGK